MQTRNPSQVVLDKGLLVILGTVVGLVILLNFALIPFGENVELLERYFVRQIDLNSEATFVTWLSSALLLLNSLCAYVLARRYWATNREMALIMAAMAAGFLLLSVDDLIGLHEYVEANVAGALTASGERDFSTVQGELGPIFGFVLLLLMSVFFARPYYRTMKGRNLPWLLATLCCVFMVAFAELAWLRSGCGATWCFRGEVVLEEGSELLAGLFFLIFQSREIARSETRKSLPSVRR